MTTSDNISLMKRWYREVWRESKNETIYELLAPNAVLTGTNGPKEQIHGPKEFAAFAEQIRSAFSTTEIVVEDSFGVDDKVVARWSATMTHNGNGLGVTATGKQVRITGTSIARIENGKIVEGWDNWDRLAMLEQIGAYSPPEAVILAKTA
ncbi:MAG: ester cyclase [Candidatus Sulfotelmatobacter sp.]